MGDDAPSLCCCCCGGRGLQVTKPVARVSLGQQAAEQRLYPQDSGPLTSRQLSNALPGNAPVHNGAVFHIAFSGW